MARYLIADEPHSTDDGRFFYWDFDARVARLASVLKLTGGSVSGDITIAKTKGVVLTASDDSLWRLKVATDGTLSTEAVV